MGRKVQEQFRFKKGCFSEEPDILGKRYRRSGYHQIKGLQYEEAIFWVDGGCNDARGDDCRVSGQGVDLGG